MVTSQPKGEEGSAPVAALGGSSTHSSVAAFTDEGLNKNDDDRTMTMNVMNPLLRRPDRISITIQRESVTDGYGIILRDNVIVDLHPSGLLIIPSPTLLGQDVIQIGDAIERVNGITWNDTIAIDLIEATGSIVFEICTTTTNVTTIRTASEPQEVEPTSCVVPAIEGELYQEEEETSSAIISNDDMEQIDGLLAGRVGSSTTRRTMMTRDDYNRRRPVDTPAAVTTIAVVKENDTDGYKNTTTTTKSSITKSKETEDCGDDDVEAAETSMETTSAVSDDEIPVGDTAAEPTTMQQAIIVLPTSYGGDHDLTLRSGRRSTIWTGRKQNVASSIWQHSVVRPNQRILAIGSHVDIYPMTIAQEYLQECLLSSYNQQRRLLSVTVLSNPPSWTIRKAAVGIGGGALVGVGAVLFVSPLHPIGHAMVLGGGALLGTEFEGPRKAMAYTKDRLLSSKDRFLSSIRRQNSSSTPHQSSEKTTMSTTNNDGADTDPTATTNGVITANNNETNDSDAATSVTTTTESTTTNAAAVVPTEDVVVGPGQREQP